MEKTLIINAGSASKKYALFDSEKLIFEKYFEDKDANFESVIPSATEGSGVNKIAIRVVSPGEYFQSHKLITDEYIKNLEESTDAAPLHIAPVLSEIELAKKHLPDAKLIAISDSEFHKNIPDFNFTYALDDVRKFGYHGISNSSVIRQIETMTNKFPKKLITCHLGSGVSITAIKNEKSFDTSMGFTPLDGVIMNTRVGSIDPGAVLYYLKKNNMLLEELEEKLNKNSGLTQISGITGGVKELLSKDSESSKLALKIFTNQVAKYIGSYAAQMGGVDMVVFTATISERSPIIREQILENLEFLNIKLDKNLNKEVVEKIGFINSEDSKVKLAVIPTKEMQEMWEIAKGL